VDHIYTKDSYVYLNFKTLLYLVVTDFIVIYNLNFDHLLKLLSSCFEKFKVNIVTIVVSTLVVTNIDVNFIATTVNYA
jgi:hypothetical protein